MKSDFQRRSHWFKKNDWKLHTCENSSKFQKGFPARESINERLQYLCSLYASIHK